MGSRAFSFFLGAELDPVMFLFSAAALAGLICDHSRCEIAVASAMDGAERDCFAGVFLATAALAGLICDPSFLASRGGVTGCPWRVRAGTMGESDDFDRARCEVAVANALDVSPAGVMVWSD